MDAGGFAFPSVAPGYDPDPGMTLLDYFAAHAPQDCLEKNETVSDIEVELGLAEKTYDFGTHYPILNARRRYVWASAMIAEKRRRELPPVTPPQVVDPACPF